MNLMWRIVSEESKESPERVIHYANLEVTSDDETQRAIDTCIEKTCGLLENNFQEDSRYLLFGWDADASTLTIVVTDDEKQRDSRNVVECQFTATDEPLDPEDIQYWIKDYLTTSTQFLRYSLIAAFHMGERKFCTLL